MNTSDEKSTRILPTREEVLRWQEELERLKEEEAAMKARHAAEERTIRERRTKLNKFVEYGMALVDMDAQSEPEPISEGPSKPVVTLTRKKLKKLRGRPARKRSKTWNATIKRIVVSSGRGMTYKEVKEEVAKTHLGETLRKTEKAFYGSIGKLSESDEIIKHHGRLYSPKAYHQFMQDVAAGRAIDTPAPSTSGSGESPNEIAIERFLGGCPDGATTSEILDNLLNNPPADLAVTKNRNSIYNLLVRQRKNGKLIRRGTRYYLPHQENEAPGSQEPSAPDHHGGGNGTSPSSGGSASAARPGATPAHPGE